MRSASARVAQPNWSGPGTAQMAYVGVASFRLLWITTQSRECVRAWLPLRGLT